MMKILSICLLLFLFVLTGCHNAIVNPIESTDSSTDEYEVVFWEEESCSLDIENQLPVKESAKEFILKSVPPIDSKESALEIGKILYPREHYQFRGLHHVKNENLWFYIYRPLIPELGGGGITIMVDGNTGQVLDVFFDE